jgi:pimeloyl-ACP methyl ester carboxylesterase
MLRRTVTRLSRWLLPIIVAAGATGLAWQWNRSRLDIAATPAPGQFVDVGAHRLHLWCVGSGSPTVVFESGLGGGAFDWGYVQPSVARFRRACTYDRAGYGYSEPGPRPRTSRQIVSELFTLLDRAGIAGPVVLVGHSFGGYNVRLFAAEYPSKVVGLVLVDASHEDQGRRYAEAGVPSGDLPPFAPYVLPVASALGLTRLTGFSVNPRPGPWWPSQPRQRGRRTTP